MMAELPVTNICIISDRKNCPPRYCILDQTIDNDDADLWKDRLFKSKTTRYLCFTKEVSPNQLNQVVTDMALVGNKDPIPPGYTALTQTSDSQEQSLRKNVLCARFVARTMTSAAIVDICLFRGNSYKERMYTLVGEVNGINLTFRLAEIVIAATRPAPPVPKPLAQQITSSVSSTLQQLPPRSNDIYMNVQRKNTSSKPLTGIEGVQFKLNDRLTQRKFHATFENETEEITIRTESELNRLTEYDFTQERSVLSAAN